MARTILMLLSAILVLIGTQEAKSLSLEELERVIKEVNPKHAEHLSLKWEDNQKTLTLERKMVLNPLRYMLHIQQAPMNRLEPEPLTDRIGSRFQPWVKLRCRANRPYVDVIENVYVEDKLHEMESRDSESSFFIIPCDPYEIEKLSDALRRFFAAQGVR